MIAQLALTALLGAADPSIPFEKYQLPNGLTVILSEDHRLPQVAVDVWYHVGAANQVPGKSGFAHLFEHMMFSGAKHIGPAPFKILEGSWQFAPVASNGCRIDFSLRFQFSNPVKSALLEPLFEEAQAELVRAFVARAQSLPG